MAGEGIGTDGDDGGRSTEETEYFVSRARHHMLDVVEATNSISTSAHSNELEYGDDVKSLKTADGRPHVQVVVGHDGNVQELDIAASAMQLDMGKLSRIIVATIELAARRASLAHIKLISQSYFAGENDAEIGR